MKPTRVPRTSSAISYDGWKTTTTLPRRTFNGESSSWQEIPHPNPTQHGNVAGDAFGCPDGLRFDSSGFYGSKPTCPPAIWQCRFRRVRQQHDAAADPSTGEVRRFLPSSRLRNYWQCHDARSQDPVCQHSTPRRTGQRHERCHGSQPLQSVARWTQGGRAARAATIAIRNSMVESSAAKRSPHRQILRQTCEPKGDDAMRLSTIVV